VCPRPSPARSPPGAVEREHGYRQALEIAGLAHSPALVVRADFREDGGFQAMASLLGLSSRPDAVFVANNLMAMGALRAARDAALRVPEDIGLVSFDDIPWGERVDPPVTVGRAAHLRSGRISRPRPAGSHPRAAPSVRRVALQTTLVIRKSCGASASRPDAPPGR
jgi:LacI family transcriptional regulator